MSRIVRIDDPDDPRIAPFRAVRERDLVGREGRFIAEGEVVARLLARAPGHRPLALLLAEQRLEAQADLIAAFPEAVPVYAAAQPVMDAIVGFHIHRGILALGERAPEPDPDALMAGLPGDAVVVAVCGVGNHDNMGGIFRNAAAFGADAVVLDAGCCDPLYRKAIRVSVGAALITPTARLGQGADVIGLLQRHGFAPLALSPSGETALSAFRPSGRTAIILGAEGPGLAPELMARARTIRIPMAAGFDSLNVAVTSGIVLHHLKA
ncbi:TrmH family RNA methyltransferase [Phenylobacterium sp.]|uniref:TrmH family RNA methyltransferase n=1 Tax=Phenylobacterium sp. TaxID=1871053 RepID=UPI0035B3CE92